MNISTHAYKKHANLSSSALELTGGINRKVDYNKLRYLMGEIHPSFFKLDTFSKVKKEAVGENRQDGDSHQLSL